jgi:excisionase family DNA binding protein
MDGTPGDLRTPKQLAKLLDVSVSTIRRWIRDGTLTGYRLGGRWRASQAEALALYRRAGEDRRGA